MKVLLGTGRSYWVFVSLILLCFIANKRFQFSQQQFYLIVIFLINYLIIYFYSVFRASVYQHSVMLFTSVAAVLAIASFIDFKNKYFFYVTFALIASVLIWKTYFKKDYFYQCVNNIFEYQFERTAWYKKNYPDKNIYPIFFDSDSLMRDLFFKKYECSYDGKMGGDSITSSLKHFNHFVAGLNADMLIMASSDPQHRAIAMDHFPYIFEKAETQGLNFVVLSKKGPAKYRSIDPVLNHSTFRNENGFTYDKPKMAFFTHTGFSLLVDSLNEYPYAIRGLLNKVSSKEGQVILAEVKVHSSEKNLKGLRLCISFNDIKTDSVYFFDASQSSDHVFDSDSNVTLYTQSYLGTNYKKIRDKTKITVYLWNSQKEKFIFSDPEIKTIDFWNAKWNYWE